MLKEISINELLTSFAFFRAQLRRRQLISAFLYAVAITIFSFSIEAYYSAIRIGLIVYSFLIAILSTLYYWRSIKSVIEINVSINIILKELHIAELPTNDQEPIGVEAIINKILQQKNNRNPGSFTVKWVIHISRTVCLSIIDCILGQEAIGEIKLSLSDVKKDCKETPICKPKLYVKIALAVFVPILVNRIFGWTRKAFAGIAKFR